MRWKRITSRWKSQLRVFDPKTDRWIPAWQECRDAAETERRQAELKWREAEAEAEHLRREVESLRRQAEQ